MGLGDWIMATAEARAVFAETGLQTVYGDGHKAYWSEVFDHNPKIAEAPSRGTTWSKNQAGQRPYILACDKERFTFREDYRAPYGEIFLSEQEKQWAEAQKLGDYIIVEPDIKDSASSLKLGQNKRWDKWGELVKLDYPWLQIGTKRAIVRQIKTPDFRKALALVAGAKLVVTTDGALHHAAAALGVPAIVLWGGVVSPRILGYPTQTNIWNGANPCGSWAKVCPHCREAMESITLDQVKRCLP